MRLHPFLAGLGLITLISAAFPPPFKDVKTKKIKSIPSASISYKETHICETKAKAYSGYVHMPSDYLRDSQGDSPYNASMYFWYFEARNNPRKAPTSIYLAGGPGTSSLSGAVSDGGPCYIMSNSNGTESNPWSWNERVNMLYVDQPVTTGFSYTELVKSTVDLLFDGTDPMQTGTLPFEAYNGSIPAENATFLYGVLPDQNPAHAPNNTVVATRMLWHFAQIWFTEFPKWDTHNDRISLSGNSYGGYWVTTAAAHFLRQNAKIEAGQIRGKCLHLDTAVITNGEIDVLYQGEWYPHMAYNNTYGLEVIPEAVYNEASLNFTKPGGCRDLIQQCRALGQLYDPDEVALNATVNELCFEATGYCSQYVVGAFDTLSDRNPFDIAHFRPDPEPPAYLAGWANQAWVQEELGVAVNFTWSSWLINNIFVFQTGDIARRAGMGDLEYLLDNGIKVALIYGDRDYRCPWLGAEQLSVRANWTGAAAYREAGYEEIAVNSSYTGGVVKQHGLLSFSRVFQAGHDVSLYQPETTHQIFNRAIFDRDIATGRESTAEPARGNYTTVGPTSSWGWTETLPGSPEAECYVWAIGVTCTMDQYEAILNNTAEVVDWVVVAPVPGGGPVHAGGVV